MKAHLPLDRRAFVIACIAAPIAAVAGYVAQTVLGRLIHYQAVRYADLQSGLWIAYAVASLAILVIFALPALFVMARLGWVGRISVLLLGLSIGIVVALNAPLIYAGFCRSRLSSLFEGNFAVFEDAIQRCGVGFWLFVMPACLAALVGYQVYVWTRRVPG